MQQYYPSDDKQKLLIPKSRNFGGFLWSLDISHKIACKLCEITGIPSCPPCPCPPCLWVPVRP